MDQQEKRLAFDINSEAEYRDACGRLGNELLGENAPEQLAQKLAQHIIYVDELKAMIDTLEKVQTEKDRLIDALRALNEVKDRQHQAQTKRFRVLKEAFVLAIEESKRKLTPLEAAKFARMAIRAFKSAEGKEKADRRHSAPGGANEKRDAIKAIWASGKYTSRDACAEQECAALDMSISTARKALRNTPNPT